MPIPMSLVARTPVAAVTRCRVCGFAEVRTDEVVDRGLVFLAECPRCEHRWTSQSPIGPTPAPARVRPRAVREAASAA